MVKGKKAATKSVKQNYLAESKELKQRLEQERLRQLQDVSSATTTTSESSDSFISQYEISEENEDLVNIFEILDDSETEILQEEDEEHEQRKTLHEQEDFFNTFEEIPNLDTISEDISVASIVIEKTMDADIKQDMGKFVNPLTGQDIIDSSETKSESSVDLEKKADEEEEDKTTSKDEDFSQESDLLLTTDILDIEEQEDKKFVTMEDTFEAFLGMETQPALIETKEIDWETLAREEEAKRLLNNTLSFLNDLIIQVVNNAEYLSSDKYLQLNLDKRKLVLELINKLPEYLWEKSKGGFLNRQIVQHFKRKKSYRAIMEDNPKTLLQDKEKLKKAKLHLDQAKAKEIELKYYFEKILQDLKENYENSKVEFENNVEDFESSVRKYLGREIWPKANALIDQLLQKMRKYRQEVTQVRTNLFLRQHNQAHLKELLNKLEDLGNGLDMKDFNNLHAETQALDKKIEERNAELNKFHIRCHNNLHTWSNYKEKQKMLSHTVSVQRSFLNSLVQEKNNLREVLYSLKLQRNSRQAQIKQLSIQGGILDKPALMYDYDLTVKRRLDQEEFNNYLKRTMTKIQKQLGEISKNCTVVRI